MGRLPAVANCPELSSQGDRYSSLVYASSTSRRRSGQRVPYVTECLRLLLSTNTLALGLKSFDLVNFDFGSAPSAL